MNVEKCWRLWKMRDDDDGVVYCVEIDCDEILSPAPGHRRHNIVTVWR